MKQVDIKSLFTGSTASRKLSLKIRNFAKEKKFSFNEALSFMLNDVCTRNGWIPRDGNDDHEKILIVGM